MKKGDWTSQLSLIDDTIDRVPWKNLYYPLLSRSMAENEGWGLDDPKKKIRKHQQVITGTTPHPHDRFYEVVSPPNSVEDSEIDDCISELPSSIHSDSIEHHAFYVERHNTNNS